MWYTRYVENYFQRITCISGIFLFHANLFYLFNLLFIKIYMWYTWYVENYFRRISCISVFLFHANLFNLFNLLFIKYTCDTRDTWRMVSSVSQGSRGFLSHALSLQSVATQSLCKKNKKIKTHNSRSFFTFVVLRKESVCWKGKPYLTPVRNYDLLWSFPA